MIEFHCLTLAALNRGIPLWMSLPFVLLLLLIAVMPLSGPRLKSFWEHAYAWISLGLGAFVAAWFLFSVPGGRGLVGETLMDYVSFMCLVGSLFVVAGGIHIRVKGEATPFANVVFLLIGAVAANLIGTTGASMVLIRPFIRMNKIRITGYHIVFFIFIVSNCGGALTPVGDPPLFLGYLRGIPFFWLIGHVLGQWVFTIGLLLTIFYVLDRRNLSRVSPRARELIEESDDWHFEGWINLLFLGCIVLSVFIPESWHSRELVMLGSALASYFLTAPQVHASNHFNLGPIKEVGLLFIGIFLTMMPSLAYLTEHGHDLGVTRPKPYYFASGALSSVLDNAPTYLNFFQLAEASSEESSPHSTAATSDEASTEGRALKTKAMLADPASRLLIIAVSLGSVFFGAMTYIGNGPNFMVKSIADSMGVHTPDFLAYIYRYSLPLLFPVLLLGAWFFL